MSGSGAVGLGPLAVGEGVAVREAGRAASLAATMRPRAMRSPAENRGPRSGKLREGSNALHHLQKLLS